MSRLPIHVEDLLSAKIVEGERIEFKEGWNPKVVMRSVCAFANDFFNQGSGYVVLGVEEEDGKAKRPVKGFDLNQFEKVQKELIGYCNQIQPAYAPHISLEEIDGRFVVVIWVPAGSVRPYKVPDDVLAKHKKYNYRIRQYSSSVVPNAEQENELIQLTAKIPFDDRVCTNATVDNLNFGLMREHLYQTKSRLFDESSKMSMKELAQAMNLCEGADEHLFPKNIALLMFSDAPSTFFPSAQIDVVHFPNGAGAKEFSEKIFTGPIQTQLKEALRYIESRFIQETVEKVEGQAEAHRFYNYPFAAIEEVLANAVYHRDYQLREPIEVRILPRSIEIISYSGVDPSIKQQDLDRGRVISRRYRNRRIGDFLKELSLTEGRGTGIPAIYRELDQNGSPAPRFNMDDPDRRFFFVELLAHPYFEMSEKTPLKTEAHSERWVDDFGKISERIRNEYGREPARALEVIYHHPEFTAEQIAAELGKTARTVENYISTLKQAGAIVRKGPKLGGHWEVISSKGADHE